MTNLPAIALTPDAQGRPTCLSTDVALHFQKKHSHVLRDIDRIRSMCPVAFFESNFGFKEMETPVGFGIRKDRAFRLTRDAFSLLVMGMTGPAAIRWKLRYIEAFNAMERELAERQDADLFLAGARPACRLRPCPAGRRLDPARSGGSSARQPLDGTAAEAALRLHGRAEGGNAP